MELSSAEPAPGRADAAMDAVDEAYILPYFLLEVQRQEESARNILPGLERRDRRPIRMPSFDGDAGLPNPPTRPRAVLRGSETSTAVVASPDDSVEAASDTSRKAEWLAASLDSAVQSSDALSLVSHLQALASRLFTENAFLKGQVERSARERRQARRGRLQAAQRPQPEGPSRVARDLADEDFYLHSFISSDRRVIQNAALVKARREHAASLENNKRLQEQADRDRQVIVELELKSRTFADAYAWLTNHNRMINARDAPALVALWRKRVAQAGAAGKGTIVPEFTKDLAAAYARGDSEGDMEAASEDGGGNGGATARLLAAEIRQAEAVSEARQAELLAERAEQRAAAAEKLLAATQAQLEAFNAAASPTSANPSLPSGGAGGDQLQAALTASQRRAAAAERECVELAAQVKGLQAALDAALVEKQCAEAEKAKAISDAQARLSVQAAQHAGELAELQAQHRKQLEGATEESVKLRKEFEEIRKQCEYLTAELNAAKRGGGEARSNAPSPKDTSSPPGSDISTIASERDSYKATASRLERDIKQLRARVDEAAQLEKTVAVLKDELAAAGELKKAYEALQSEAAALRDQLGALEIPIKHTGPAGAKVAELPGSPPVASAGDATALNKECDTLREKVLGLEKHVAELEREKEALKKQAGVPKVAPAQAPAASSKAPAPGPADASEIIKERDTLKAKVLELEKELGALRTSAQSPGKEPDAIIKERDSLKERVLELEKELGALRTSAHSAGKEPDGILKERDTLKAKVLELEKELGALRTSAQSPGKEVPGTKESPAAKELPTSKFPAQDAQPPLSKKLPAPLPKPGKAAATSRLADTEAPAVEGDQAVAPKELGTPLPKPKPGALPPKTGKAPPEVSASEGAESPAAGETASPKKLGPPVGKKLPGALPPKSGKAPPPALAAVEAGDATTSPPPGNIAASGTDAPTKGAKSAVPALLKPAAKDTKVPAPPKKAPPVDAAPVKTDAFCAEAKEKLDAEIAMLREQVANGKELKKAHEALQKEMEALRNQVTELQGEAKTAGAPGGKSAEAAGKPPLPSPTDLAAVTKERDDLLEKFQALEKELASVRASQTAPAHPKKSAATTPLPPSKAPPVSTPGELPKPSPTSGALTAGAPKEASRPSGNGTSAGMQAKLEQEIRMLREQVAAGDELRKAHEALKEEVKNLQADNESLKRQAGAAQPQPKVAPAQAPAASSKAPAPGPADASEIIKERDTLKAKVLELEKELGALRTSAQSPGKEPDAIIKERDSLKERVLELEKELGALRTSAQSPGKEPDAIIKERDSLKERVLELEKELGALRTSAHSAGKEVPGTKESPAAKELPTSKFPAQDAQPPLSKKLPAPLPKPGKAAATSRLADTEAPAVEGDQAVAPKELGTPLPKPKPGALPPKTGKAPPEVSASEGAESPAAGETASPKKLGPPVGKKLPGALPPKSGKAPPPALAAVEAGDATTSPPPGNIAASGTDAPTKDAKSAVPALPKPAARDTKVPAPPKKAPPVGAAQVSEDLLSETAKKDASADLEAELQTLRPKAEAAAKLEQEIARLREQLAAGEELKKTHAALEKETEALKNKLSELQTKAGKPASPEGAKAAGGPGTALPPPPGDLAAVQKERDALRERVLGLEKELAAFREAPASSGKEPTASKEGPTTSSPLVAPPAPSSKKPPPPLSTSGKATAVVGHTGAESPAEAKNDQSPSPKKLEPPAGKKTLPSKAGKAPGPSEAATDEQKASAIGASAPAPTDGVAPQDAEASLKDSKSAVPVLSKPVPKDTKVPPPPKKAPPVVAPPGAGDGLTLEAKEKLEREIASLQEQLAASGELRKAHEALQREVEALQGELRAIRSHSKPATAEPVGKDGAIDHAEAEALRKERNSLKERVAALEAELASLQASGQAAAAPDASPKSKGAMPHKAMPGKAALPGTAAEDAGATEARAPKAVEALKLGPKGAAVGSSAGDAAKKDSPAKAVKRAPSLKTAPLQGPPDKKSLLTEEVLSKSDAETEAGDTGDESHPAEERVAELTERLIRAKRRIRNLVVKCNALVDMEKDRDTLRSRLEALQAKHDALSKAHLEATDKTGAMANGPPTKDTMVKSASAAALSSSPPTLRVGSMSTMETGISAQSSSALLETDFGDLANKYEKLKVQRDKLYQSYKAQKDRIAELEQQEVNTKNRIEKLERLYQETKEELEVVTAPHSPPEESEGAGLFSWLGGAPQEQKNLGEEKLRARLDLLQQRLEKAAAENEALKSKLAQLQKTAVGSPRESETEEKGGEPGGLQKRTSQHLSPEAIPKKEAAALAKFPAAAVSPGGRAGEAASATLAQLQKQIHEKDTQIEAHKAEIRKLKAVASPSADEDALKAGLAKRETELKEKESELAKAKQDVLEKEKMIQAKTEEVKNLKAKLDMLEKEKAHAIAENNALKKQLEGLQKELELLKAASSASAAPTAKVSGESGPTAKAVKRAASITKRPPGPPSPAPKTDRAETTTTAASVAAEASEKKQKAPAPKEGDTTPKAQAPEITPKAEGTQKGKDGATSAVEGSGGDGATKKKKKSTKKTEEGEEGPKELFQPTSPTSGEAKTKKKKKNKEASSGEYSDPHSERESVTSHADLGGTTTAVPATGGWGFGLFGAGAAPAPEPAKPPSPKDKSTPRPSLLELIVGPDPVEETPKERELPPLKLSTVEGAEDQSDESSSEGEGEGGLTSTIAGFFWGI